MTDTMDPSTFATLYASLYTSWWRAAVRLSAGSDDPRAEAEHLVYAATRAILEDELVAEEVDDAFREAMVEHAARRALRGAP